MSFNYQIQIEDDAYVLRLPRSQFDEEKLAHWLTQANLQGVRHHQNQTKSVKMNQWVLRVFEFSQNLPYPHGEIDIDELLDANRADLERE
ncbi:MAG: hypothetical protein OHK0052_16300 [Anaerolineales bacterium]